MSQNHNQRQEIPMQHLFDGTDLNVYDKTIVNLSAGAPGPDLLRDCCKIFKEATDHRMNFELENNSYLFQYGPSIGTDEHRAAVADFLSKGYESEVNKSDIVLTAGASHGLHLILSTLLDMSATIIVDEVTYMIALEAFHQFSKMRVITVPLNSDGPNLEELEKLLSKNKFVPTSDKLFWGLYYTIPTFHNPTGILFSENTNRNLVKLARKYDILIACDDVYNLLHYNCEKPPTRLFAYDIEGVNSEDFRGNVISNGSFSKITSPGLRMGWMECPPLCLEKFRNSGVLKSGGAANNYTSGIMSSLIQLGLAEKHLRNYSRNYKERMETMCDILTTKLPSFCSFEKPKGGYFVWIKFPETFDCISFNKFCRDNFGVFGIAGQRFSAMSTHPNYMRLTFAFHDTESIRVSMEKFCQAISIYQKQNSI